MDVGKYLVRIGYRGSRRPSLENLMEIHSCHVLKVPFGSLAIHCGEDIVLELPTLYRKVVDQRREGFCYELNGLFSWLLGQLGYTGVSLLPAQVYSPETQRFGPPREHLALLVELEERRWLCDVAYGKGFRRPLILEAGKEQRQESGTYTLTEDQGTWYVRRSIINGDSAQMCAKENTLYKFTLASQRLEDFKAMCLYQQTSPRSLFFSKSLCCLHLPGSLITLTGRRLTITQFTPSGDREKSVTMELEEERIPQVLREQFGIMLSNKLVPKDQDIMQPSTHY
ncbi:arylamine N-acetyltransferase, pineal gland isozyme NAT-3-like isoform X2 [Mustelus asterias]